MKTILSYLDNMFMSMPKTPEVLRAKEELAAMMEDKYNELLAEGKKENEAVGIVISEFGDLEELAEELGIRNSANKEVAGTVRGENTGCVAGIGYGENAGYGAGAGYGENAGYGARATYGENAGYGAGAGYGENASYGAGAGYGENAGYGAGATYGENAGYGAESSFGQNSAPRMVSMSEAEEYLSLSAKTSKWISIAIMLCVWSPTFLLFWGGVDGGIKRLGDRFIVIFGLVPLFVLIGIAVAIIIYNDSKMKRFEHLKNEIVQIDEKTLQWLSQVEEVERPRSTKLLIVGILFCIFSVIPLLVVGCFSDNDFVGSLLVDILLVMVGIGAAVIVYSQHMMECIKVLKQEEDYTKSKKESNKVMDLVGGIYWPIVTAIYLGWSFWTMNWGFTWVIWPIAGVIFGAIAAVYAAVHAAVKKEY